jgi:hypothetical protein
MSSVLPSGVLHPCPTPTSPHNGALPARPQIPLSWYEGLLVQVNERQLIC